MKHAGEDSGLTDKRITVRVTGENKCVLIAVTDHGVGIPAKNLTGIFKHGVTTKEDGHGFRLHSGANAANEMGGSLKVSRDGTGRGATFTLNPLEKVTIQTMA